MSRRKREDEPVLSLDSFLDIVTNVVGVLILVAVVTVLGAGEISVSSGASVLSAPRPSAARVLIDCDDDRVFVVDEEGIGKRVQAEMKREAPDAPVAADTLVTLLEAKDVGDASHRVKAESRARQGLSWTYVRREGAVGQSAADLERIDGAFQIALAAMGPGSFVYFVVRDDSFEVFRRARDVARARGLAVGWHPVEGNAPLRLSVAGSLGKRVQ